MQGLKRKLVKFALVIILLIGLVTMAEIGFRTYLKLAKKDVITILSPEEVLEKAWFEPHPYLIYVFKPNHSFIMNSFKHSKFTTNQFGFRSTLEFDVQTIKKPAKTLRIATLGGSTTMGANGDNEVWPYLIGKYLQNNIPEKKIEILNEGIMGYTSLDNLLDLSMRVIDFSCDGYVIYLGINDLLPKAPLHVYRTDYSHFRTTLYENLNSFVRVPSWLLKLKSFRAILQAKGVPDNRNLIANTGTEQFRKGFELPPSEMSSVNRLIRQTVRRNIVSMIGLIRAHYPKALIFLASFYDLANQEIMVDLNKDILQLAGEYKVVFVDVANEIPRRQEMVYDYVHFTPLGDQRAGQLFAGVILKHISSE